MKTTLPKTRLLLVGGSLTHICLLNQLSGKDMERLKIILVAPYSSYYYLDMAAGYLEENFADNEVVVDVSKLCKSKGVHLVEANPIKLDLNRKSVMLEDGRNITFDMLSLNIDQYGRYIEGVAKYAIPIDYFDNLKRVKQHLLGQSMNSNITIVGAGKLGIEIAFAIRLLLEKYHRDINITIIEAAQSLLPGYELKAKNIVMEELKRRRIEVLLGRRVIRVTGDLLIFNDNSVLDYGYLIWTAKPVIYPILEGSGLATDQKGRLLVNSSLKINNNERVFGCGESIAFCDLNRPLTEYNPDKEAEILLANIINTLKGKNSHGYLPIEKYKRVINLGNKKALILKHELVSRSARGWRFRKNEDEKFIKRLQK